MNGHEECMECGGRNTAVEGELEHRPRCSAFLAPTERPILFKGEMIRAILEGRKVMTRRVVKLKGPLAAAPYFPTGRVLDALPRQPGAFMEFRYTGQADDSASFLLPCPYGKPGDRLWVRETFQVASNYHVDCRDQEPPFNDGRPVLRDESPDYPYWEQCYYAATESCPELLSVDTDCIEQKWRPSIHMPRWASRILLEVTEARVERLQDISEADAEAEGVGFLRMAPDFDETLTALQLFKIVWESINGPDSWALNPWVWVVSFQKLEGAACTR